MKRFLDSSTPRPEVFAFKITQIVSSHALDQRALVSTPRELHRRLGSRQEEGEQAWATPATHDAGAAGRFSGAGGGVRPVGGRRDRVGVGDLHEPGDCPGQHGERGRSFPRATRYAASPTIRCTTGAWTRPRVPVPWTARAAGTAPTPTDRRSGSPARCRTRSTTRRPASTGPMTTYGPATRRRSTRPRSRWRRGRG